MTFEKAAYSVDEQDDPDTADTEEHKAVIKVTLSEDPDREVVIPLDVTEAGSQRG